jgi:septal ring factor EnvC (AmiA/AmiB activator)
MRSSSSTQTLRIATARLEFHSDRRLARALHVAVVAALLLLVFMIGRSLHANSQASVDARATLERQNATLRADISRARMELELERSTRVALEREVAQLNDEARQLQSRLEFFNAQSGRTVPAR